MTIPFQILETQIDSPRAGQPQQAPFGAVGDAPAVPVGDAPVRHPEQPRNRNRTPETADQFDRFHSTHRLTRNASISKPKLHRAPRCVSASNMRSVNQPTAPRMPRAKKSTHPFKAAVGQRLAAVRQALGLSQDALAAQLGVSRSAYAGYEQGLRLVSPQVVVRLNRLYGVTTDWIYRGSLSGLPEELRHSLAAFIADHPDLAA
ncbi:MAG TPA: XRE family transcriptional regulator [Rhodospirillales bacterium]|nr:XRE family transcriptional regulator [Rhodospirillales bacterium]